MYVRRNVRKMSINTSKLENYENILRRYRLALGVREEVKYQKLNMEISLKSYNGMYHIKGDHSVSVIERNVHSRWFDQLNGREMVRSGDIYAPWWISMNDMNSVMYLAQAADQDKIDECFFAHRRVATCLERARNICDYYSAWIQRFLSKLPEWVDGVLLDGEIIVVGEKALVLRLENLIPAEDIKKYVSYSIKIADKGKGKVPLSSVVYRSLKKSKKK